MSFDILTSLLKDGKTYFFFETLFVISRTIKKISANARVQVAYLSAFAIFQSRLYTLGFSSSYPSPCSQAFDNERPIDGFLSLSIWILLSLILAQSIYLSLPVSFCLIPSFWVFPSMWLSVGLSVHHSVTLFLSF